MAGWGVSDGTLGRLTSGARLTGRIELRAGDCMSFLMPLTAGGATAGAIDEDSPRGAGIGVAEARGV